MILADKIMTLRKKAGWSQEELAAQLNVSRQSVSKWEGAQSIPDMDKVVQMSRLFGVTTDFLLKDELEMEEHTQSTPIDEPPLRRVTMEEASAYLALRREAAPKMALATGLCILSPVALLMLAAMSEFARFGISENAAAGIGLCVLLVLVASIGCAAFVYGGTIQSAMDRLLEEGDYTRRQKSRRSIKGAVSTVYWLLVTAIFMWYTFGPSGNGQARYSWFIWAIAGVVYAAVMVVMNLIQRSKK